MRIRGTVKGIATIGACLICGAFAYALTRSPVFDGDGYELYAGTSSAAVIVTDSPATLKLTLPVAGESARFQGDVSEELLLAYRARVLFCEEADGVRSYYCYSPLLGEGILLNGVRVNLHIAAGKGQTAAGTPVIFGGW